MRRSLTLLAAAGTSATLALGTSASAHDGSGSARVRIQDDCDPTTFNAALFPGACVGDGDTTFDELVASLLSTGDAKKWRMHPRATHVDRGETLALHNQGGEHHTFTEVDAFGPGCEPDVNALLGFPTDQAPAADCEAAFEDPRTSLSAGASGVLPTTGMLPGVHRFQCMIHPWMTATVEVRRR